MKIVDGDRSTHLREEVKQALVKMFSVEDKAQIVVHFIRSGSTTSTRRWWRTTTGREPPSAPSIRRWYRNFHRTGNVANRHDGGRPPTSDELINAVREIYKREPSTSVRSAATQLGVSHTTVHNILRKALSFYPYRIQTLQALRGADHQKRLEFAQHVRSQPEGSKRYLGKIVFSDECIFRLNGYVNKQNVRIWGEQRPTQVHQATLNSPSVMVWCAISKQRVIGPFFFENENVTGESYRNMLINYAFPRFERNLSDYIFMQDGASPHFSTRVRAYLNWKKPNYWIGRGGPVHWPARSPDLTPCDFFLWGHLKARIYATPVLSTEDLKARITREVRRIPRDMLKNVWENVEFRLEFLTSVGGGHIEQAM